MLRDKDPKHLVAPALGVAIIAVSFAAIFFKRTAPTDPLVAAGLRLGIAGTLLLPFTLRKWRQGKLSRRFFWHAVAGGMFYGVHFGAWVSSLHLTSVTASVTLVAATPLMLAIVGFITGRDRPDARLWLALAVATIGLAVIGSADAGSPSSLLGDGLALLGAFGMACYMLISRRLGVELDVWLFVGIATLVGCMCLLGSAAALGIPIEASSPEALLFIVLAALLPQLVGHTLITWSLRYTRPTVVGIATLGEPLVASVLAWLWLGETVRTEIALGALITVGGLALALRWPRQTKHKDGCANQSHAESAGPKPP